MLYKFGLCIDSFLLQQPSNDLSELDGSAFGVAASFENLLPDAGENLSSFLRSHFEHDKQDCDQPGEETVRPIAFLFASGVLTLLRQHQQ